VNDAVHVGVDRVERRGGGDVRLHELERAVAHVRADVDERAHRQVVNPGHLMTGGEQPVDQVRAKETGGAGHENLSAEMNHECLLASSRPVL
jgi:hypothetical protein